jgi:hypothetical protein
MSAVRNKQNKVHAETSVTYSEDTAANGNHSTAAPTNGNHKLTALLKPEETEVVRRILKALAGLDYGSVEIIVQDSRVVQIERTQRSRFPKPLEIPPQP